MFLGHNRVLRMPTQTSSENLSRLHYKKYSFRTNPLHCVGKTLVQVCRYKLLLSVFLAVCLTVQLLYLINLLFTSKLFAEYVSIVSSILSTINASDHDHFVEFYSYSKWSFAVTFFPFLPFYCFNFETSMESKTISSNEKKILLK